MVFESNWKLVYYNNNGSGLINQKLKNKQQQHQAKSINLNRGTFRFSGQNASVTLKFMFNFWNDLMLAGNEQIFECRMFEWLSDCDCIYTNKEINKTAKWIKKGVQCFMWFYCSFFFLSIFFSTLYVVEANGGYCRLCILHGLICVYQDDKLSLTILI